MKTRTAFGLAVCLLAPVMTGCMQYPCAVRGQSPTPDPMSTPSAAYAPDYGYGAPGGCPNGQCAPGGGYGGPGYAGDYYPGFGDRMSHYGQHIHGMIPQHDHVGHYTTSGQSDYRGPGWYPTHHHFYSYHREDDLVYPPANTPGAIVQYPYYTCKGPSDFFMQ